MAPKKTAKKPSKTKPVEKPRAAGLERELDQALEATFPASDPFAIGRPTSDHPLRPADRRPAEIDRRLVERLADEVGHRHADEVGRKH